MTLLCIDYIENGELVGDNGEASIRGRRRN